MKVTGTEEESLVVNGERFMNKDHLPQNVNAGGKDELNNVVGAGAAAEGGACAEGCAEGAPVPPAQQVARVCEGLLLSAASALRVERLRALRVTRVLSAAPELPDTPLPPGVAFERVALADSPGADLARHLDAVADAVHQERLRGGTTLIHCVAGVSRSAALCLAYLVKHLRMPLRKAFAHLRAHRPCVRPNAGFFRQLIDFERAHLGAASVAMVTHPAPAPAKALCIPDVYEPEYRATLWLQRHYPTGLLGRH